MNVFSLFYPSVATLVDAQNTIFNLIFLAYGTEKQKQKYLPQLAKDLVTFFIFFDLGRYAFALKTTAKKQSDHYVLNGTKMWISNTEISDLYLVMANSNPQSVNKLFLY